MIVETQTRICVIPGCGKKEKAKGWCAMHHQRYRRNGDPLALKGRVTIKCQVENCDAPAYRKYGYCYHHTYRFMRYGDPLAGRKVTRYCTVPGCGRPHRARGWCGKHYVQYHLKGGLKIGAEHRS